MRKTSELTSGLQTDRQTPTHTHTKTKPQPSLTPKSTFTFRAAWAGADKTSFLRSLKSPFSFHSAPCLCLVLLCTAHPRNPQSPETLGLYKGKGILCECLGGSGVLGSPLWSLAISLGGSRGTGAPGSRLEAGPSWDSTGAGLALPSGDRGSSSGSCR